MSDLREAIEEARATLAEQIPLMRDAFGACWDAIYGDLNRKRDRKLAKAEEPTERVVRCGSCEHPDGHDPRCGREGCQCHAWESMPSTVGWTLWTGAGQAEVAYTRATKELQGAHDAIGQVHAVPAHWSSDALVKPGPRTVPMHIDRVHHGISLLAAAIGYVTDDLAPPEASALMEAADHAKACVNALEGGEDRLRDDEWADLVKPRCAVQDCRVVRHANGLCQHHYDLNRRGKPVSCLEHDLEIVMDMGIPDPRLVICRACRRRWRLTRMNDTAVSNG